MSLPLNHPDGIKMLSVTSPHLDFCRQSDSPHIYSTYFYKSLTPPETNDNNHMLDTHGRKQDQLEYMLLYMSTKICSYGVLF